MGAAPPAVQAGLKRLRKHFELQDETRDQIFFKIIFTKFLLDCTFTFKCIGLTIEITGIFRLFVGVCVCMRVNSKNVMTNSGR